jgi:hypothetical protein
MQTIAGTKGLFPYFFVELVQRNTQEDVTIKRNKLVFIDRV